MYRVDCDRFARNLEAEIKRRGMTYTGLARRMDTSYETIKNWLTKRYIPNAVSLYRLSKALGIPMERLLKGVIVSESGGEAKS